MHSARWALLLAILLAPTAGATLGVGSFTLDGSTFVPEGSDAEFDPLFALTRQPELLRELTVSTPRLVVHEFSYSLLSPTGAGGRLTFAPATEAQWNKTPFDDALVRLAPGRDDSSPSGGAGNVGLYPGTDMQARFLTTGGTSVEARDRSDINSSRLRAAGDEDHPFRTDFVYRRVVEAPHVLAQGAGLLLLDGSGRLKVYGPDLEIVTPQGTTTIVTGDVLQETTGIGERRWVILEFEDARSRLSGSGDWLVGGALLPIAWDGAALITASAGALETLEGIYVPTGRSAHLVGHFDGVFSPEEVEGRTRTMLEVSGDVSPTTTLGFQPAPAGARFARNVEDVPFLPILVGVAVMAGMGGAAWTAVRRRARTRTLAVPAGEPRHTVDDCLAEATQAADDEDWEAAILWLDRLRALAPTSARVCADLAHAHCQLGMKEEGLRLYAEASRLSYDGEADFNAAIVSIEAERPIEETEGLIERALQRTPTYVVDVEGDSLFAPLKGRPRFDRAVEEAWRQVEDADPSDGASVSTGA